MRRTCRSRDDVVRRTGVEDCLEGEEQFCSIMMKLVSKMAS